MWLVWWVRDSVRKRCQHIHPSYLRGNPHTHTHTFLHSTDDRSFCQDGGLLSCNGHRFSASWNDRTELNRAGGKLPCSCNQIRKEGQDLWWVVQCYLTFVVEWQGPPIFGSTYRYMPPRHRFLVFTHTCLHDVRGNPDVFLFVPWPDREWTNPRFIIPRLLVIQGNLAFQKLIRAANKQEDLFAPMFPPTRVVLHSRIHPSGTINNNWCNTGGHIHDYRK